MKNHIVLAVLGAMALSMVAVAGMDGKKTVDKSDSSFTLPEILKSELKPDNRFLILKDRRISDSLVSLSEKSGRLDINRLVSDSNITQEIKTQEEFHAYWTKAENREGITALRNQYARADIDKSLVAKVYLFDSSVVVYPGIIILRVKYSSPSKR